MNPLPTPTTTRPGANVSSVDIAAAVTIGCRKLGMSTPGPSPILVVRSAASAKTIHTSANTAGES